MHVPRRLARALAATVALTIAGGVALVWVAFRRPPVQPVEDCRADRRADAVVVAAGSSTTHASLSGDWVGMLRATAGDRTQVVNAGRNGDTSAGLRARLDAVVACEPDAVIVLIGGNDVRDALDGDGDVAGFERNLDAIVTRLRDQTGARIALLSLTPVADPAAQELVAAHNAAIRAVAGAHGVSYLPAHERLRALLDAEDPAAGAGGPGSPAESALRHYVLRQSWDEIAAANGSTVLTDGLHLSDRAARIVATLVDDWLRRPDRTTLGCAPLQRGDRDAAFTRAGDQHLAVAAGCVVLQAQDGDRPRRGVVEQACQRGGGLAVQPGLVDADAPRDVAAAEGLAVRGRHAERPLVAIGDAGPFQRRGELGLRQPRLARARCEAHVDQFVDLRPHEQVDDLLSGALLVAQVVQHRRS